MDIAYFKRQFDYDMWANSAAIASLSSLETGESEQPIRLMSHIFVSQRIWLMRLIGEDVPATIELFPLYSLEECGRLCAEFNEFWKEFFDNLTRAEIAALVRYKTTPGIEFSNSVQDIVSHVVNHSTYHRAQIATMVRAAGKTPAVTDFIAFVRQYNVIK